MRRPFVTTTFALALAIAPAVLFAQTPPAQSPAQTPPAQPAAGATQPAAATTPAAKLAFTTDAGLLLVQIKPDQTAAFEELITKLKAGMAKTGDPVVKQQASGWKVFKAGEPMAGNALYVIVIDPAVKQVEYDLFGLLQKTMTPEELRAPEAQDMFKKFAAAFAAGYNKLNLTPLK